MSVSTAVSTIADGTEPPADNGGRRRSSVGGAVSLYSGLEGVTFQKGWMEKAVGTPTSGGKSFEYFVVGEEREGPEA